MVGQIVLVQRDDNQANPRLDGAGTGATCTKHDVTIKRKVFQCCASTCGATAM